MQIFYDTCSLLNESRHAFEDYFFISNITLKELENIKTSASKDANIKFKARKLVHLLDENEDKYTIINYQKEWDEELKTNSVLPDTDDSRIILTAKNFSKDYDIIFTTKDLNCKQLAKAVGLNVKYLKDDLQDYTGYKEVIYNSDEELANIYQKLWSSENEFNLLANEYLIIKNNKNEIIDKYKYKKDGFVKIPFNCFESKMFGKIKPKDEYQALAMDSLKNNKITMIRGAAGTGKSMLAMTFLFSKLEKGDINKIIIFVIQ
jgi:predicted ribonuclease YlaK